MGEPPHASTTIEISLGNIVNTETVPVMSAWIMGLGLLIGSLPWASAAVLNLELSHSETIGVVLGAVTCFRALFGPFVLIKVYLVLSYVLNPNCGAAAFANQCCRGSCMKMSCVCLCMGLVVSAVSLATLSLVSPSVTMAMLTSPTVGMQFLYLSVGIVTGGFTIYGGALGYMRGLPVDPHYFVTAFGGGILINYLPPPRCCFNKMCSRSTFCDNMWVQLCTMFINVDDPVR